MALTVNMPQLGESVTEGTIARWLKQPGESVAKYESIAEVVTDKVNAEIPAPADGTMGEIVAQEGSVVAVGQPICTIEDGSAGGGEPAAPAQEAAPAQPAQAQEPLQPQAPAAQEQAAPPNQDEQVQPAGAPPQPAQSAPEPQQPAQPAPSQAPAQPQPVATGGPATEPATQAGDGGSSGSNGDGSGSSDGYHLTPAVRMLVREHDVDLSTIQGSGIGGRITKKDVLEHVQRRDADQRQAAGSAPAATAPAAAPAPEAQPAPAPPAQAAAPAPAATAQQEPGDTVVPLTPGRRAIAEHMVRSKQTSPHAWMMMEADMSAVFRLRAARKAEFQQRYGISLTFLPFVARATIEALRRHPSLNATWSDQGVVLKHDIHLGIAVALEDNLIVPVVRNADRLSIAGLAQTMADLGERARGNRLKLDEIQGGTFTLNNTGALGTVMTQAIINQPQAAILAMDAVIKRPVVIENDAIAVRPMMNLGLSFDHRLNDGLQATRFLKEVKEILEGLDDSAML